MRNHLNKSLQPAGNAAMPLFMRALLILLIAWLSAPLASAESTVTARLDRETISLGETVTLSLVFEDAFPKTAPELPEIPNTQVIGTSKSQQSRLVNGEVSQSVTYDLTLVP